MQRTVLAAALIVLTGCDRNQPAPSAPPPSDDKPGIEFRLDTEKGAVEFKKDEGAGGDNVDVEVKTE